jgi:hypothetical protein
MGTGSYKLHCGCTRTGRAAAVVEQACTDSRTEFDFLRGDTTCKRSWGFRRASGAGGYGPRAMTLGGVLAPSYNYSQYVVGAIDSVISQTKHDIEHVIVDGGVY